MKQTLAKLLYNKRMEKSISMTEAAEEIGISYVSYWRYETLGNSNISYKTAKKLALFLEIPAKEILDLC